jgi:hypothetical protein
MLGFGGMETNGGATRAAQGHADRRRIGQGGLLKRIAKVDADRKRIAEANAASMLRCREWTKLISLRRHGEANGLGMFNTF